MGWLDSVGEDRGLVLQKVDVLAGWGGAGWGEKDTRGSSPFSKEKGQE